MAVKRAFLHGRIMCQRGKRSATRSAEKTKIPQSLLFSCHVMSVMVPVFASGHKNAYPPFFTHTRCSANRDIPPSINHIKSLCPFFPPEPGNPNPSSPCLHLPCFSGLLPQSPALIKINASISWASFPPTALTTCAESTRTVWRVASSFEPIG